MDKVILRQLQIKQLEILEKVDQVCNKHGIKYYLCAGTLLGAVRHKGFIPWDDDIDISMPYDDYLRFIQIAQDELGEKYFLQNSTTERNWYRAYSTIRIRNTKMLPQVYKNWDIDHGIWLDIFPLVFCRNEIDFKLKKYYLQLCYFVTMDNYVSTAPGEFRKMLKIGYPVLMAFYKIPLARRKKIQGKMLKPIFKARKGKIVSEVWSRMTMRFSPEIFEGEPVRVEFEGKQFMTVPLYHQYLTEHYGDYMKPVQVEKGHEGIIVEF